MCASKIQLINQKNPTTLLSLFNLPLIHLFTVFSTYCLQLKLFLFLMPTSCLFALCLLLLLLQQLHSGKLLQSDKVSWICQDVRQPWTHSLHVFIYQQCDLFICYSRAGSFWLLNEAARAAFESYGKWILKLRGLPKVCLATRQKTHKQRDRWLCKDKHCKWQTEREHEKAGGVALLW